MRQFKTNEVRSDSMRRTPNAARRSLAWDIVIRERLEVAPPPRLAVRRNELRILRDSVADGGHRARRALGDVLRCCGL